MTGEGLPTAGGLWPEAGGREVRGGEPQPELEDHFPQSLPRPPSHPPPKFELFPGLPCPPRFLREWFGSIPLCSVLCGAKATAMTLTSPGRGRSGLWSPGCVKERRRCAVERGDACLCCWLRALGD